ncbi:MAG: hypothetical protein A3K46_01475 [Chloroflexi bacterium RBG_13_60_9]|nr:MAG: hypothetical protein A3K46_01475 [Chloroflexi bacterium RBG_13_60_9]
MLVFHDFLRFMEQRIERIHGSVYMENNSIIQRRSQVLFLLFYYFPKGKSGKNLHPGMQLIFFPFFPGDSKLFSLD